MASKVLVVGAINGQLTKAFQKISKLHAKTDFAFAIVIGNLFSDEPNEEEAQVLSGSITVPLPTYFTIGDHALPQAIQEKLEASGEVCPNLFYLGRKGTLTTTGGIKIVFLGGRQVQNEEALTQSIGKYEPLFLDNEARVLQGAHDAHILLSNQWPSRIENGSIVALSEDISQDISSSTTAIANLCATLKPRYHFCPSSSALSSWKREPFIWPIDYTDNGAQTQVTRFEALGSILLKNSEWLSAFTLDITKPTASEGAQRSAPFSVSTPPGSKRKREALEADPYIGRRNLYASDQYQGAGRGGSNKRHKRVDNPAECFMCPNNATFDGSMMVSIADESFLTSLKGPLPTTQSFSQLQSTGNIMIIPMYHAADTTSHGSRNPVEARTEFNELTRYRYALQHMLQTKGKGELSAICWVVERVGIRHFHWQFLTCPTDLIANDLVEGAFKIAAGKNDYEKFKSCDPAIPLPDRPTDFFRVWIWSAAPKPSSTTVGQSNDATNGASPPAASLVEQADALASGQDPTETSFSAPPPRTSETSMYFPIGPDQRFNIQFGRTVMASLLKLEPRTDWRDAARVDGEEGPAKDAEAWKADFGEFDFAMM